MLAFVKLAGVAQEKKNSSARDKFLVLAGEAAHHSGCKRVADRCRLLVADSNPGNIVSRFDSFAAALEDPLFRAYLRQLSRYCSYERAEHLLTQRNINPGMPDTGGQLNPGDYALLVLRSLPIPGSATRPSPAGADTAY
jgi:hypothetical protein